MTEPGRPGPTATIERIDLLRPDPDSALVVLLVGSFGFAYLIGQVRPIGVVLWPALTFVALAVIQRWRGRRQAAEVAVLAAAATLAASGFAWVLAINVTAVAEHAELWNVAALVPFGAGLGVLTAAGLRNGRVGLLLYATLAWLTIATIAALTTDSPILENPSFESGLGLLVAMLGWFVVIGLRGCLGAIESGSAE
jgi:hypothetical protein